LLDSVAGGESGLPLVSGPGSSLSCSLGAPLQGNRRPKPKKLELKLKKPNCISVNSIQKPQFNSVFDFYFGLNWKTETVLISVLVQRPNPIQLKNMGQGNPTSNPKCI
jgi:hypothetical protein